MRGAPPSNGTTHTCSFVPPGTPAGFTGRERIGRDLIERERWAGLGECRCERDALRGDGSQGGAAADAASIGAGAANRGHHSLADTAFCSYANVAWRTTYARTSSASSAVSSVPNDGIPNFTRSPSRTTLAHSAPDCSRAE